MHHPARRQLIQLLVAVLAVASVAAACSRPSQQVASSTPRHDAGAPVRDPAPWQWQTLSDEEYLSVVVPYAELPERALHVDPKLAPPQQRELVARLQFWTDALDERLRLQIGGAADAIPRPRIMLARDGEANAFVNPVPVCMGVGLRFIDAPPGATTVAYAGLASDGLTSVPEDEPLCVRRELSRATLAQVAAWFSGVSPGCVMRLEDSPGGGGDSTKPALVVSGDCPMDDGLADAAGADEVLLDVTADRVLVTTGLVAQFPRAEWMIVPTLAHELGHYYRAHMTERPADTNFYYRLADQPPGRRPVPDPTLAARGALVTESARLMALAAVPRQRLHSALFWPAARLVRRHCDATDACRGDCAALADGLRDGSLVRALAGFPEVELSDEAQAAYRVAERRLTACAATVPVGVGEDGLAPAEIARELEAARLSHLVGTVPAGATLGAVWTALDRDMPATRRLAAAAVAAAERDGLARYTSELEADEFGVELFAALGFEPRRWTEADFAYYRPVPEFAGPEGAAGDLSMDDCERLYHRGWRDADGQSVVPARGNYWELHPYACYRIYNADREIAAHAYHADATPPPAATGTSWARLAALARRLAPPENDSGGESAALAAGRGAR